jgi:lipoate-protein ligase A
MAVDEAVLQARIQNTVPNTVRFYCWQPSAVSIGKFQKVENEALVGNCRKYGVDIVRRVTGGGTVYHDNKDEITYSVVASKTDLNAEDITSTYVKIYSGLAEALRMLGVTADFNEGNVKTCPNLTVDGKKISGSAQSHKGNIVLQHGTLLVNIDLEKMFTFLRVPWAKTCMEIADVAKRKITSISKELGRNVMVKEANDALIRGFQKALNIKFEDGKLTLEERESAEKLFREKYATDEWNFHGRSICKE